MLIYSNPISPKSQNLSISSETFVTELKNAVVVFFYTVGKWACCFVSFENDYPSIYI